MYKEISDFLKCVFVTLNFSASPSPRSHMSNCLGFIAFFCGERIKCITRSTICSESSWTNSKGRKSYSGGNSHLSEQQRHLFGRSFLGLCPRQEVLRENLLIPQGWLDASAYVSIISYISSFLKDLMQFVPGGPSVLELKRQCQGQFLYCLQ